MGAFVAEGDEVVVAVAGMASGEDRDEDVCRTILGYREDDILRFLGGVC